MIRRTPGTGLCVALLAALGGAPVSAQLTGVAGATCSVPPAFHCPDGDCPGELIAHAGNTRLPKSRRDFFLDYPCDLKPGERVTFVLSLHGGGMNANWHRHYFPLVDLKDRYRLVIATPNAIGVLWSAENDDAHLRSLVTFAYDTFGAKNIAAFWLVGHSHGGVTANRISRDPFYRNRLTGLVSRAAGSGRIVLTRRRDRNPPTCCRPPRGRRIRGPQPSPPVSPASDLPMRPISRMPPSRTSIRVVSTS